MHRDAFYKSTSTNKCNHDLYNYNQEWDGNDHVYFFRQSVSMARLNSIPKNVLIRLWYLQPQHIEDGISCRKYLCIVHFINIKWWCKHPYFVLLFPLSFFIVQTYDFLLYGPTIRKYTFCYISFPFIHYPCKREQNKMIKV